MSRDLYTVTPAGGNAPRPWVLRLNGDVCSYHDTQQGAIDCGVMLARNRLKLLGKTAEMKIMGTDGRIRDSRTYGDDPREIKG